MGSVAGCCERGNEPSRSMKGGIFIHQFRDYHILKKDCAPWS